MRASAFALLLLTILLCANSGLASSTESVTTPLGLPELPIPADNPMTSDKILLGEKLFLEKRFSANGRVACASCHDPAKGFTDSPLSVSEGIDGLTGTRNAPTLINAAYFATQFWDGRSPSLEDQALHPFVNPVEMGLKDHEPILAIVRADEDYAEAFDDVFDVTGQDITMDHVTKAIAAFERTIVAGDSPFDRWFYGDEDTAMTAQQKRGYELFINEARCVSCHVIEQTHALFTDNRFHDVGVGITEIPDELPSLAKTTPAEFDAKVLTDARTSELGRFVVTGDLENLGSFKTPTLRNVAVTAPYMHDGSLQALEDVMKNHDRRGISDAELLVNDPLSGGIRPLALSEDEIADLVAFLEALTSPAFAGLAHEPVRGEGSRP